MDTIRPIKPNTFSPLPSAHPIAPVKPVNRVHAELPPNTPPIQYGPGGDYIDCRQITPAPHTLWANTLMKWGLIGLLWLGAGFMALHGRPDALGTLFCMSFIILLTAHEAP